MSITKTAKTEEKKTTALSDTAQKYLDSLKKKYGNINFTIQDYNTDEEAARHLSGVDGPGEYNCVITSSLLEKMATDEETAAKYEAILSGAGEKFDSMKQQLGEDAEMVKTYGVSVNDKGDVSYYAILKETFAKINQSNEKIAEKRAAEKENDKIHPDRGKEKVELTVKANTIEALVERIKSIIDGKAENKSKDGFAVNTNDNAWANVGGKKDGFIENDAKAYNHNRDNGTSNGRYYSKSR
jgi:hypothetical protein